MKILVDMNLSPARCRLFSVAGYEAKHWSEIGNISDPDSVLIAWALNHGFVIFTHDLDFGMLIHARGDRLPSVFQIRADDVAPSALAAMACEALRQSETEILGGAIVTIYSDRHRVSILPRTP